MKSTGKTYWYDAGGRVTQLAKVIGSATYTCPSPKLKTALNSHFDLLFFDRDPAKL
jgi:hypothetical protein